ncbi:MAG: amidohydrolase family protein [Chloroflexota bacterium]
MAGDEHGTVALLGATVIDGTGGAPKRDATVVVRHGRIAEVSRRRDLGSEVACIDVAGKWVMPGLIDCHVHLAHWGQQLHATPDKTLMELACETVDAMRTTLEAGCTTARDLGGLEAGFREGQRRGLVAGPRLQCSLVIVSPTNGIVDATTANGLEAPVLPGMPRRYCNGPHEARAIVREVLHRGADVIKIATTGGVSSPKVDPRTQIFTREEVEAIVDEAHMAGVTVTCHALGGRGLLMAVQAGVDCIEHGAWLDEACMAEMARRGTWWVPTFAVYRWHGTLGSELKQERARGLWEAHRESFQRAMAAGVRIAMGTDIGGYGYGDTALELELLVENGMTAGQAIEASTRRSAECLGLEGEVGTLEPGKLADLLVVASDPLADVRVLRDRRKVELVMQGGRVVADRRA